MVYIIYGYRDQTYSFKSQLISDLQIDIFNSLLLMTLSLALASKLPIDTYTIKTVYLSVDLLASACESEIKDICW